MSDVSNRERARARLRRRADALERIGAHEVAAQEARGAAAATRARLEAAHPEFGETSQRRAVAATLTKIAVPIVWLLDVLIFGALAEYVAAGAGLREPWLLVAKCLFPGLLIAFDLWVASLRQTARDAHLVEDDVASRRAVSGWNALAVALLLAYVAMVWATQRMAYQDSVLGAVVSLPLALGLTALALVIHAALIFSGADVKTYMAYSWRHGGAAGREAREAERARGAAAEAVREFNRLSLEVESYNEQYAASPFRVSYSRQVRELLRREFGHDVILRPVATPPAEGAGIDEGVAAAPPPPSDHEVRV